MTCCVAAVSTYQPEGVSPPVSGYRVQRRLEHLPLMTTIAIRLDPQLLTNPDLDLRYTLTERIIEQAAGSLSDDGYDYCSDYLVLFFASEHLQADVAVVVEVISNERILGNDLRPATVVAVERDGAYEGVYPSDFRGTFLPE